MFKTFDRLCSLNLCSFFLFEQESNPALRLKEEVIAANTLTGTGTGTSSGTGPDSGDQDDPDKRRIPIDVDPFDGNDIDEVITDFFRSQIYTTLPHLT